MWPNIDKINLQTVSLIFAVHGLVWQAYLAGGSITAPRILIFSISMVADSLSKLKSID